MTAENSRNAPSPDVTPVANVAAHKNIGQTSRKAGAEQPATTADRPSFELSGTQIFAGTAAAVTAAVLGSRLGVAGTIVGAALASVISIVAGAVYSHSIAAARHRVRSVITQRGTDDGESNLSAGVPELLLRPVSRSAGRIDDAPRPDRSTRTTPRRPRMRGLLLAGATAAAVFAGAIAIVTGVETIKGSPLAGGSPGGLSLLGGARTGDQPDPGPDDPAPDDPAGSGSPGSSGSSAPLTSSELSGGPGSAGGSAASTTGSNPASAPASPPTSGPQDPTTGSSSGATAPSSTAPSSTAPDSTALTSTAPSSTGGGTTTTPTTGSSPSEPTGTDSGTDQAGSNAPSTRTPAEPR